MMIKGPGNGKRAARVVLAVTAAALALGACSPRVATRGNLVDDYRLAQIQAGTSTAGEVRSILGSPTTVATFDDSIWYYIGQRTETVAFFAPEVTERRILRIKFDPATGVVDTVQQFDLSNAQDLELVSRQTPTLGRELGLLEQFLGNLGKFTGSGGGGATTGMPTLAGSQ
jgi:outer membrane protein assembly factor BamE (lipoprotein component of BamABCDE complex)